MTAKLKRVFYATLIIAVLAEFFVPGPEHARSWWHTFPGFNALYGFLSCVLIVLVSKALGKIFLVRKEDYYTQDDR